MSEEYEEYEGSLEEYGFWGNYETHCVSLLIDFDSEVHQRVKYMAYSAATADELAKGIRRMIEAMLPPLDEGSLASDLLTHAMVSVDWQKIAEVYEWFEDAESERESLEQSEEV